MGSRIFELPPEPLDESREAAAHARWRKADVGGDLGRVETSDEPKSEERAVLRLERTEDARQVDALDTPGRVAIDANLDRLAEVDHRVGAATPHQLASLVRGDCDKPCPDLGVVT